jgi:hypothetical protein
LSNSCNPAPPGSRIGSRRYPARPPEEQGWQELDQGGWLHRPRAPGTGAFFQERLARQLAEGQGAAKDAEVERIEREQSRMLAVARAARELRRLRPEVVVSWTSDPPFPARTTYVPMIGADLATIGGPGHREWMALQDLVLLVVHPDLELDDDNGPLYGLAKLYSAPPATPPPNPAVAPERQGWAELAEGDFLLPWLLHITRYEL